MTRHISADSPWWEGLICILGLEGIAWEYYKDDKDWWEVWLIASNSLN